MLDAEERVVGGITWRHRRPPGRARRGHRRRAVGALAGARRRRCVEDFCARLAGAGYAAVHTHFGPGPFPFAPGFRVDRRWGGLVRFLGGAERQERSGRALTAP